MIGVDDLQTKKISSIYTFLSNRFDYMFFLEFSKAVKFHFTVLFLGITLLYACSHKHDLKRLKLPAKFNSQFEELRQYGRNQFFTIDFRNQQVVLCHFERDSLLINDSIHFNTAFVDVGVHDDKIVLVNYRSLIIYDLANKNIERTISLVQDSTTYPYSFHRYFKVSLSDSFLYIENYCIACADDFRKGYSYPLEKRYNIYSGKAEFLEAYPTFLAKKYFLKSDNFISRVHAGNAVFYTFLNEPKILKYELLTRKSQEICIKEMTYRPQFIEDTTEFTTDYYSYVMNHVTFSTSNQRIFYNEEDAMLYNFKFLGLSIDSVDAERKFVLQQINNNGEVRQEYPLQKEDRFNLIFMNHHVFIEKKDAKKTYFEQIPI